MKRIIAIVMTICIMFCVGAPASAQNISIMVDGEVKIPDVAPQIIDGRTMVPVRFIAELFGCEVSWDANSQSVIIISKEAIAIRNKITLAEFDAIQVGMTYNQVVNIIGGSGEKTYEYDWGADFAEFCGYQVSTIYRWDGVEDYSSASVTFHDNVVESKNQYDLK